MDRNAVTGFSSIWVDKEATSAAPDAIILTGSGFVESVQLGPESENSLDGRILFDAYESRHTTAIGPVPGCAGTPDGLCIFRDSFEEPE